MASSVAGKGGKGVFFEVLRVSSRSGARAGILHTEHGPVETPGFVPVATCAALKGPRITAEPVSGPVLMFANTYHLAVNPGADVVAHAGGVHGFTGRRFPFITDSGGFQAFSLAAERTPGDLKGASGTRRGRTPSVVGVDEGGITFRSYRDGTRIRLTPETTVDMQKGIGADIILPLDQLLHAGADAVGGAGASSDAVAAAARDCFERTHRWMERSLWQHLADPRGQRMLGIVHGGTDLDLRRESVARISALPFDGFAVGGSLGTNAAAVAEVVAAVKTEIASLAAAEPAAGEPPVHVLGIGDPKTAEACVLAGADTMDSAYPTKVARHGSVFQRKGGPPVQLRRGAFARDLGPLDPDCDCSTCRNHSRAYLHHLVRCSEPTAMGLLAEHNLAHMRWLFSSWREKILAGDM